MSTRVSISRRTAQELLDTAPPLSRAADELKRALESRKRRPVDTRKAAKRQTNKEKRSAVREEVMKRADGRCEGCNWPHGGPNLELDHFFGRARSESVETCWALCATCHLEKTRNEPSAAHWLNIFHEHCCFNRNGEAAELALALLAKHETKAAFAKASEAAK